MSDSNFTTWHSQDIDAMEQRFRANFINSLSGFKSATLLGTTDGNTPNLAVISSVIHIGANPPLLGMVMRPHTVERHSLANIKNTGKYTLNQIHTSFIAQAHQTSARYPANISEFDAVGLTPWNSQTFSVPFVAQSSLKIGLSVVQHIKLCNETELVIGQIQEVHSHSDALSDDGYLDIERLGSACISGLDSYHSTTRAARFAYAKPEVPVKKIT